MASLEATATLYDTGDRIRVSSTASVTTTGDFLDRRRIEVGTSEESIAIISDITGGEGAGWCFIKNEDATNYVQVGIATTSYFAVLAAGDALLVPLDAGVTDVYLKANTAACNVTIDIRER